MKMKLENNEKIIIFGAGQYGASALNYYGDERVTCFCDNNKALIGKDILGKKIISYDELEKDYRDYKTVIAVKNPDAVEEIMNLLSKSGIKSIEWKKDVEQTVYDKFDNAEDEDFIEYFRLMEVPEFQQVRIETTNNCGCKCYMCPRDSLKRKRGTMSLETLTTIVEKLSYIEHPIEFHIHGFGEALLCKDLPKRMEIITKYGNLKPVCVTTLAYNLDEAWFESIFRNGLKKMIVSLYAYSREDYKLIHGKDGFIDMKRNLKYLSKFKDKYDLNIEIKLEEFTIMPTGIDKSKAEENKQEFVKYLESIGYKSNNFRMTQLHNYGNHNDKMPKHNAYGFCSIFWGHRKEVLQIDWEGNVVPCCFDINSDYIWGNINNESLEEIFTSKKRLLFLKNVIEKKYIPICDGCYQ